MSTLEVPTLELNDGTKMPALGFGCYKVGVVPGSAAGAATASPCAPASEVLANALAVGYRCFDCAQFYENEAECGEAFEASGVPREDLFLISKVWTTTIYNGPEAVREQIKKSIVDLRCKYIDLYLVHWPVPGKHVEAYKAILEAKKDGEVKSVGVSNYTIEDFEELRSAELPVPSMNQIEINPFLYRKKTIEHFQKAGVRMQAYRAICTFGKPTSLSDEVVASIAAKNKRSAAQVLGRWAVQKGFHHIPKSEKRARMEENAQLFDWELDEEDMHKLEDLTPPKNLETFKSTYVKCVYRDTPMEGKTDGIHDITLD